MLDDFLCGCLPGGTFEAMITPSDSANLFAKVGVMTMDFIVGCISRDMALVSWILTDEIVKKEGISGCESKH